MSDVECKMENSRDTINISDLPEFAQAQLLDFYEFLRAKHNLPSQKAPQIQRAPLSRFVLNPIKVKKIKRYSRDELHER